MDLEPQADYQNQLQTLSTQRNALMGDVARLEQRMALVSAQINSRAPIHRLPAEVLTFVFKLSVSRYNCIEKIIARICSRWRAIAVDTPELWRNITFTSHPLHALNLYIERSHPLPIRAEFNVPCDMDPARCKMLFRAAQASIPRWESVILRMCMLDWVDVFADFVRLVRDADRPLLKSFEWFDTTHRIIYDSVDEEEYWIDTISGHDVELSQGGEGNDPIPMVSLFSQTPPPDLFLRVKGALLGDSPSFFSNITNLELSHMSFNVELVQSLNAATQLKRLTLDFCVPPFDGPQIFLPMLTELYIINQIPIGCFLSQMILPELESLWITDKSKPRSMIIDEPEFVAGQHSFPKIRSVTLAAFNYEDCSFVPRFEMQFLAGALATVIECRLLGSVPKEIFNMLIGVGDQTFWPELQRIESWPASEDAASQNALLFDIASRRNAGGKRLSLCCDAHSLRDPVGFSQVAELDHCAQPPENIPTWMLRHG